MKGQNVLVLVLCILAIFCIWTKTNGECKKPVPLAPINPPLAPINPPLAPINPPVNPFDYFIKKNNTTSKSPNISIWYNVDSVEKCATACLHSDFSGKCDSFVFVPKKNECIFYPKGKKSDIVPSEGLIYYEKK